MALLLGLLALAYLFFGPPSLEGRTAPGRLKPPRPPLRRLVQFRPLRVSNTETGVVIDSSHIAKAISERFKRMSYAPDLNAGGRIIWKETGSGDAQILHRTEPGTNAISLLFLWLLGWPRIEQLF